MGRKRTHRDTVKSKHIKLLLEQNKTQSIVFSIFYSWIEWHSPLKYLSLSEALYIGMNIWSISNNGEELLDKKKLLHMNDKKTTCSFQYFIYLYNKNETL